MNIRKQSASLKNYTLVNRFVCLDCTVSHLSAIYTAERVSECYIPAMNQELLTQRIGAIRERLSEVEKTMADPEVASDPRKLGELGKEHARLERTLKIADALEEAREQLDASRELLDEEDEEMAELARAEVAELETQTAKLESDLYVAIVPASPEDDRNAIIEIRAGTGGEEAGLFAGDLYRMYQRFAERQNWSLEVVSMHASEMGGFKEVIFTVKGDEVYGILKFEGGVHRVQRVPETESQGRIHTSAATVAVLPEAEEVDVAIDPKDLRIDVYRSSGPGGQSVNTTDSAVRITHVPTGLVVTCQDEKSQHKNKAQAMRVLRSRLYEIALEEERAKRSASRKQLVSTGDRSAKIRTYNFPQGRVTDHRINLTLYRLNEILEGDLYDVLDALRLADAEDRLKEATQQPA